MRVVRSEGDPLAYGPEDRFIVIIVRRHVCKGDRHVGCVQKGCVDRHFGIRHDKGISALAKRGEEKGLAQRIRHDKRFQYIALVRRDGEGYGLAGAYAALADSHFSVRCLHGAERMAGRRLRRISVRIFRGDRRGGLILVRDLIVCGLFTGKGQGPVRQDGGDIVAGENVAQNRAPCSAVPPPADGDGTGNDLPDAPLHTGVVIGKFRLRGDPYACFQVDGSGRKRVCCRCRRPCDLISLAVPEQPLDLILLYDLIQAGQMLRQKIPAGCDGDASGERVTREVIAVFHLKIADLDRQIASADDDGDLLCLPVGAVRGKEFQRLCLRLLTGCCGRKDLSGLFKLKASLLAAGRITRKA